MEIVLYDAKGNPYTTGFPFYKNHAGKIVRVPSMFGPKKQIMEYLQICFLSSISPSKENETEIAAYLTEMWEDAEHKTKKVLEMLEKREKELREDKSIRALLYQKVREKLGKLTIPIFNIQQLAKIANISFALDEIEQVLNRE